ncbi:MAG: DUF4384 domain-containing protein [Treponema sp.]|nr:DUF4384 domain-containing protein [Treponema sp.]
MKKITIAVWAVMVLGLMGACAGSEKARTEEPEISREAPAPQIQAPVSQDQAPAPRGLTLDDAIRQAAGYIMERIPADTRLSIVGVDTENVETTVYTHELPRYINQELRRYLEASGRYMMIEDENTDKIANALKDQLGPGYSDRIDATVGIGNWWGAQWIVIGRISPLGGEHRLVVSAMGLERKDSVQHPSTITLDPKFTVDPSRLKNLPAAVDRAVYDLSMNIPRELNVTRGRIFRSGTSSVTTFSDYLNSQIMQSAQKQKRFQVQETWNRKTQATVEGEFTRLGNDVEVSLRLVPTGEDKTWLGTAKFVVPQDELERRDLSVETPVDNTFVDEAEYKRKMDAVSLYDDQFNTFLFTITADKSDGIYYDGQTMDFTIDSEKDCYIVINHVDIFGNKKVLFPIIEKDLNVNKVTAGKPWRLMRHIKITLSLPKGEEFFLVAAYDQPIPVLSSQAAMIDRETEEKNKRLRAAYPHRESAGTDDGVGTRAAEREKELVGVGGATELDIEPVATAYLSYTILPRPK